MEMMMKDKEKAWKEERARLLQEQGRLNRDVKHYQTAASVASQDVETLYAELGIVQDTNQKLASERSLERAYQAYRDVGYQAGLKDGYAFSYQGLERKKTSHYNSKAKKQLTKLLKEFDGKTTALLEKLSAIPLMSLQELKSLFATIGSPSDDSYP
ncbi:hypothetical protein HanPSC8_Chr01g0026851 [Helianthus annuus]|nr:hypothetical protein HanPSC8_Chr01g0026851 [Helianthus annuus]